MNASALWLYRISHKQWNILNYFPYTVILFLACWLRVADLSQPSLWIDEAFVAWFTSGTWPELLYRLHIDGGNLPAHFLFVKLIIGLLGNSEFGLRLFSVFMGCTGVILAMALGWQIGKEPGSLAAGWFWAFNPMAIWYSRDAKPYAFTSTAALALLSTYLMVREGRSRIYTFLAVALLALGSLGHYYFFLIVMALILLSITDMNRNPTFFRKWFLLSFLALLPLTGWLTWFFTLPSPSVGIGWIRQPDLYDPLKTIWNLVSGYGGEYSLPTTIFGILALIISCLGVIKGRNRLLLQATILFGLMVPIGSVWAISQKRPIYMDRYFIVILVFATPAISAGMEQAWKAISSKISPSLGRVVAIVGFTLLISIGLWAGSRVHSDQKYSREDWRGLAHYLKVQADTYPLVWLSDPEAVIPFQYYYHDQPQYISSSSPPSCPICWYVLRQPYTETHAFAQGVTSASRPWKPPLPPGCYRLDDWESRSGLALWKVSCEPAYGD